MRQINCLSLEQNIGLKEMISREECIIVIVTLDLRPRY